MSKNSRDEFSDNTKNNAARRASYICSNPDCRHLTLFPSNEDQEKSIYIGEVAHISSASKGGPRYDPKLSSKERKSIKNAIFLCSNCAIMVDKNNGLDYPKEILLKWKKEHEIWVKSNLNKSLHSETTHVNGEFMARGKHKIRAIRTTKATIFKPGTKATAEGENDVIALDIE